MPWNGSFHALERIIPLLLLFMMLILGGGNVWGQTHPYTGIWYLNVQKNTAYYMVPAADPQITPTCEDAYFSSNYSTQNGDPEKPFITTYQTGGDLNSIWIFVPVSGENNYYYIVHAQTGKYVKYQTYLTEDNTRRKFVHLESIATPGETEKFEITKLNTGVKIKPKNNAMYFNVAGDNQARYNGGTSSPYYSGMVGGMTGTDNNSQFNLTDASATALTPVITYDYTTSNVSITCATLGSNIYYTTNGSTPTTSNTVYEGPFSVTSPITVKAIVTYATIPSSAVAELDITKVATPTITFNEVTREATITAEGAEIYYTIDDTDPTLDVSTTHAVSPIVITNALPSTKIHAQAVKNGCICSDVAVKTDIPVKVLTNPTIVLTKDFFDYDGSTKEPVVKVMDGDVVVSTEEYEVIYSNNKNAGTASVTVSDKEGGDYQVNSSKSFTILPKSIGDGNRVADDIFIEISSEGELSAVKHGETILVEDTDYTQETEVDGDDKIITITGMGNYTGSVKALFANPIFTDPDNTGSEKAAAVYTASSDLAAPPPGINAYIVRKVNPSIGTLVISKLDYIPEGVPVLLLSNEESEGFVAFPKDPSIPEVTTQTKNSNQLKVSQGGETVEAAQIYMFYKGEFVLSKAGTLGEGAYYLCNPNFNAQAQTAGNNSGAATSRGSLQIVFDDEPTGIIELKNSKIEENETDIWYTLNGRRLVSKPATGGIYIRKGQKIFIKRQ